MILIVSGTILATFQKFVPRRGTKMKIVLTLVSFLGPKVSYWTLQTMHFYGENRPKKDIWILSGPIH